MRPQILILLLIATLLLVPTFATGLSETSLPVRNNLADSIRFEKLPPVYAQSTAEDAISLACAPDEGLLQNFFQTEGLLFRSDLLRTKKSQVCHVFYRPTIRGFRADTENLPVTGLYLDVDLMSYVSKRAQQVGDSLDIAKQLLPKIRRPLKVTVGVKDPGADRWVDEARAFHFPDTAHEVVQRRSYAPMSNPWVQDYLKSGTAEGKKKILVTRMLYEGSSTYGDAFKPMLDQLREEEFERSKLSWEGGDLLFAADPNDPKGIILLVGNAAKKYWGTGLSQGEYLYVLRVEFGADKVIDLSGLAPHVDYFVTVLPYERLILVAEPVTGNTALAQSAVDLLAKVMDTSNSQVLNQLHQDFSQSPVWLRDNQESVLNRLNISRASHWSGLPNPSLWARLDAYVSEHCADDVTSCLTEQRRKHLHSTDPELLQAWVSEALVARTNKDLPDLMLALAESQMSSYEYADQRLATEKVSLLKAAGFDVRTIPRILPYGVPWAGISYTNSILIDRTLFVPFFGLGEPEVKLVAQIQETLKGKYDVVPIFARHNLIHNGGLHCTFALIRGSQPEENADATLADGHRED